MNILLGAVSFALCSAVPSLLVSASILYSQTPRRPSAFDDFLVVAYYAAVTTGVCTVGFLVPTSVSGPWRKLTAGKAALIAGVLSLLSPIVYFLLLFLSAVAMNTLFRSPYAWLGIAVGQGIPGLVLGICAHYAAKYSSRVQKFKSSKVLR